MALTYCCKASSYWATGIFIGVITDIVFFQTILAIVRFKISMKSIS
jgi:hypothetical protein